jgi:hypothetical protein
MSDDKGERDTGASDGGGPKTGPSSGSSANERSDSSSGDGDSRGRDRSATSEAAVGFDAAAAEAYAAGRTLLSPVAVHAGRDAHITFEAHLASAIRSVGATPGPVPAAQIESLHESYVKVPEYATLLRVLRSRRLLVLVGPCSSGRSTTALHLLNALTDESVARLPPSVTLATLDEQLIRADHGYLGEIELVAGEQTRVAADRLADLLERQQSHCVLIARPSPGLRRTLGHYWVECPAVDPYELLEQHLDAGVNADDDPLLLERVMELATDDRVRELLRPAASPAQVAEIAGLVLAHGRGEIGMSEVESRADAILYDERIEEWFSVLAGAPHGYRAERARRLTAMRIAVAVFDGMARHIAESTAEDLAVHMGTPAQAADPTSSGGAPQLTMPRTGVRLLDPDDALSLLASTPVECERRELPDGRGVVPGEIIRYRDDRMPSAVLRCVWQGQYALRDPMIRWLADLSCDPRMNVRHRAAQAAGLLCTIDFTHTFTALIRPAAEARPAVRSALKVRNDDEDDEDETDDEVTRGRRQFAAVAMDHAARDPQLQKAVRAWLSRWRRSDDPARRWTAAIALGYDVGARNPHRALEELRVLGTPWEARRYHRLETSTSKARKRNLALRHEAAVYHAAGWGVAGLFSFGAHQEVLDQLQEWIADPRRSVRLLAYQAVIYVMELSVARVGRPEHGDPTPLGGLVSEIDREERRRWPVLLALHGRRSDLQGLTADLVRQTIRSSSGRKVALEVLGEWFQDAEEDDALLAAVEAFLPLLVVEESDRGRLRGLVREMRHQWEDPLHEEVADRLEDVIAGIRPVRGRKVFL